MGTVSIPSGYYIYPQWVLYPSPVDTISISSGYYIYPQWVLHLSPVGAVSISFGYYIYLQWVLYLSPVGTISIPSGYYIDLQCGYYIYPQWVLLFLKQKKKYFHDRKLEQLEQDSDLSSFWKTLKSMNDNFEESSPPQISEEEWINYFSKLHSNKQLNDFQKKVAKSEPQVEFTYTNDLANNLNAQISNEEIKIAVKNLKTRKSAYSGRIKNEMIKVSLPELWKMLSYLFNLILKTGILPQLWCEGLITPIFKSGEKKRSF